MTMLKQLWARFNRIQAPVPPAAAEQAITPKVPLTSERYVDSYAKRTQQQDQRHEFLAGRICAINNANVVRDYGAHIADESRLVEQLSAEEERDIEHLMEVKYHKPKWGEISLEMKAACHLEPRE
jgi:hypothetical protein